MTGIEAHPCRRLAARIEGGKFAASQQEGSLTEAALTFYPRPDGSGIGSVHGFGRLARAEFSPALIDHIGGMKAEYGP